MDAATAKRSQGTPAAKRKKTAKLPAAKPRKPSRKNKKKRRKSSGGPRRPRTRKEIALAVLKWGAIGGAALMAIGTLIVALIFWYYGSDDALPNIESMDDYRPKQVVRVTSSTGEVIGEVFTERRTFVPYERIPKVVVDAYVSAEDANFWEHEGIDYWGMVRALWVNLRSGEKKQGASTITQQVVKTFLLSPERTFKRKIQEIILARRLEGELSKEDILTLYLNQIYLGHGRYGIVEAARFYFDKELSELDIGEVAMLAGLPQAPENISPKKPKNVQRAKARQKYVLEQMAHNGYITLEEAKKYINAPIRVVRDPFPDIGFGAEWVGLARASLAEHYSDDELDELGGKVVTTMDMDVQRLAHESLRAGLRELDDKLRYGRAVRKVAVDQIDLEAAKLARRLPEGGPKPGEVYRAVVREVGDDGEMVVDLGDHRASVMLGDARDERLDPEGTPAAERFAPGHVIRVEVPKGDVDDGRTPARSERRVLLAVGPEAAIVVLDPHTRDVLALAGGYDVSIAGFDRATMAHRQPGSTFKPIVYAAALTAGEHTPATIVNDAPEVYDLWKPENYKKGEFQGPVRLRYALAKSINTVAIRVAHDVGPEHVAALARDMGIESELPTTLSLALGSGEVTPLELTNAFATLVAGGRTAPPRVIRRIGDDDVERAQPAYALSPQVAYLVVQMMREVIDSGTGARARKLGMHLAGKTGTSNDARDAWFIGLSHDLVVGVWVGFDDNRPIGRRMGGSTAALPIFVKFMEQMGKERPTRPFERPQGIVEARIDKATGLLAPEGADPESTYTEVFLEGTEPTETAPAPGEADPDSFVVDEYEDVYEDEYEDDESGDGASAGAAP